MITIEQTMTGMYKFYSELQSRFLYFDKMKDAKMYQKYEQQIESYFENPKKENLEQRINYCIENNIFLNCQ